jgi:hypothetical protein
MRLMRRLLIPLIILAACITSATSSAAIPHVTACTTSFPADGHPGPWRTTNNGGTLHGNTIHIGCPSPTTHWDVDYTVQELSSGTWFAVLQVHRSGNGTPNDWSSATNPYPCDTNFYRTHVINNVSGGNANKPSNGGVDPGC